MIMQTIRKHTFGHSGCPLDQRQVKAMEHYRLSLWLLFLVAVSVFLLYTKSLKRKNNKSYPGDADEKATMSQPKAVPGKSPASYIGDPSNDILQIKRLDLIFGPPEDPRVPRYIYSSILPTLRKSNRGLLASLASP